jgi:hypothetical protein
MGSLGSGFEKSRRCPSSDLLLSYHRPDFSAEQTPRIASHLATCDFCAAELQLLSKYPAVEPVCEGAVMPPDLGALATALLTKDNSETEILLFKVYRKDPQDLTLNNMNSSSSD